MPNIQVTCPACRSVLELDAAHEGQEIECGGCQEVFVAKANKPSGGAGRSGDRDRGAASDSGRGRSARGSRRRDDDEDDDRPRRRRRDDDDDDDDDDDYRPRRRAGGSQNGLAIASLVLGLVSLGLVLVLVPLGCIAGCCCAPLAWLPLPLTVPVSLGAIITGALGVRKPEGKGMAITGIVLGALVLCIAILQLGFGFLPFLMVPLAPPPR